MLTLTAKGNAEGVAKFFDGLLTDITSVIQTKGGWVWSLPTQEYKNHRSSIAQGTRDDIRKEAIRQWILSSQSPESDARQICELILESDSH